MEFRVAMKVNQRNSMDPRRISIPFKNISGKEGRRGRFLKRIPRELRTFDLRPVSRGKLEITILKMNCRKKIKNKKIKNKKDYKMQFINREKLLKSI